MSRQVMEEIMRRARDESSFSELLLKCPGAVLGGYMLTRAEKAALMSGDPELLKTAGVSAALARTWNALDGLT
jgi:hypothetical protein